MSKIHVLNRPARKRSVPRLSAGRLRPWTHGIYPDFMVDFNFSLAAGKILRVGEFVEAHPFQVEPPPVSFSSLGAPSASSSNKPWQARSGCRVIPFPVKSQVRLIKFLPLHQLCISPLTFLMYGLHDQVLPPPTAIRTLVFEIR